MQCPVAVRGREIVLSASVGVSHYPESGGTGGELLRDAGHGLKRAKQRGGGVVNCAHRQCGLAPERRYELEQALRLAMERDEFALRYQPQVDRAGRLHGLEALICWHHETLGQVDTAMFIRLAEEIGVITAIGEWVLDRACRQIRQWRDAGLQPPRVAINVSPVQFASPGFVDRVKRALAERDVDGGELEMEVTEGTILQDLEESTARMAELRALGVRIALDDFGVGYSPLAYLNQLPLDVLKIDRTFVGQSANPAGGMRLVETMTVLAHQRGLAVVAEGVETESELAMVQAARCDAMQGYLIAPPLEPGEIERLLRTRESPVARLGRYFVAAR